MTNTLSSSISTGITLTPTGTDQSPFTITSTGTIAPKGNSTAGVYGSAASGLTLINQGYIAAGGGSAFAHALGGDGVFLSGASSFSNSGTIEAGYGGSAGTGGTGVFLVGAGSFGNSGYILGGNGGVGIYGGIGGNGGTGVSLSGAGSFGNSGTIDGGYGGGGGGVGGTGVALSGSGLFSNNATITGGTGGANYGGVGGTGAPALSF